MEGLEFIQIDCQSGYYDTKDTIVQVYLLLNIFHLKCLTFSENFSNRQLPKNAWYKLKLFNKSGDTNMDTFQVFCGDKDHQQQTEVQKEI